MNECKNTAFAEKNRNAKIYIPFEVIDSKEKFELVKKMSEHSI
jgi:hypothetical protein